MERRALLIGLAPLHRRKVGLYVWKIGHSGRKVGLHVGSSPGSVRGSQGTPKQIPSTLGRFRVSLIENGMS